jgi:peptide/nickel transport system ATP-binding protein
MTTPSSTTNAPLLQVQDLKKHFPADRDFFGRPRQWVRAVEGVSFDVHRGRTLGIVGESGCGKSTTARLLMHLIEPDEGRIRIRGQEFGNGVGRHPLSALRKHMQMVFQDSYASLNPRLTIEDSIAFGPQIHGVSNNAARVLARDLLDRVGLKPDIFIRRYPHELSGGQRQRVNIARALAIRPEIVILDEAVSALDKSVQAQVLNLLAELKREFDLTYLFISHDLNVVQYVSDEVMVMYLGQVVESGPVAELYARPLHPTPAPCSTRCRHRRRASAASMRCSKATRPTRSPHLRAVASTRAARMPSRCAHKQCPYCARSRAHRSPPAIACSRTPATAA